MIGSVVGALLICCVLYFVCVASRGGKKTTGTEGRSGHGNFESQHDETSQAGEVEMETH